MPLQPVIRLERISNRIWQESMCGIITQLQKEQNGGSGIGLSIAQAVAEAYGGKTKVSSKDGKSILFQVTI